MNEHLDKKPLVSILIPTFNRAMLLKRAVESVLKQDYPNIEIIISDNASEDNTTDIVNSFSSEKIKYIKREKNIGAVLNGIEGYKNVSGKYYMLLCDDDYLVSNTFISNSVEVMENNDNISVIKSVVKTINSNDGTIFIDRYYSRQCIKGIDYLLNYGTEKYNNIVSFFGFFRKDVIDKTELFTKEIPNLDTWLYLYSFLYGDVYFLSDEICGCYYENNNISNARYSENDIKNIDYMVMLIEDLKEKATTLYPEYKDIISQKIEKVFSRILIWQVAQLCKIVGKKRAFKLMKNTDIIKKYPYIRGQVFGNIVFTIPFNLTLFGINIDKKYTIIYFFGLKISIKNKDI